MKLTQNTVIGWIGTGVMGAAMAARIRQEGYPLMVYNRSREKAASLLDAGAKWAATPKELAAQADVIFSIVGFPRDVREVYFGEEGILAGAKAGSFVIDMTTTEPSLAVEIYNAAKAKEIHAIDAPVSGGDVGARNGTLSIMIGGDEAAVSAIQPLLALMGKNLVYQGPAGSGQHTKMCNQIVIAGTMIGMCESLLYARRAGLDLTTMLTSISGGAASCWALSNLAPRIVNNNYAPGFYVEHFIKDMGIALAEAERMNLALPGLALVRQLYVALKAQGHAYSGTQALILALDRLSSSDKA